MRKTVGTRLDRVRNLLDWWLQVDKSRTRSNRIPTVLKVFRALTRRRMQGDAYPDPETWRKEFALIGIVIVSHGLLAEGLKDAVEMIVGPQTHFLTVSMQPDTSLASLRTMLEQAVTEVASDGGTLVLVDILGGSPANASSYLALHGIQVICGVNLPMLLELLIQRENSSQRELTAIALQAAKQGVIDLTQQLTHHD
ncbi:MAG TPA: PTS sugar transporter subunit IIA [Ktedonobacteraceae bacterium]